MREAADGLHDGRVSPRAKTSGHFLSHSTASALRWQRTRLATVPLTAFYIVGEGYFFDSADQICSASMAQSDKSDDTCVQRVKPETIIFHASESNFMFL